MSLEQAFRISSILWAGVSFVALALGTGLPAWLVFFTTVALLVSFARAVGAMAGWFSVPQVVRSAVTWNVLVLAAFFGFVVESLTSGELLYAGLRFLMVLMIMKLFRLRDRGDYLHLHAITVVMMLAAALRADLWYVPLFIAYLALGVWTLFLHGMTRQRGNQPFTTFATTPRQQTTCPSGFEHGEEKVAACFFQMASGLALAVLCLTVLLFYALPRLETRSYHNDDGAVIRTAGFSDSVNLGALGPIKLDPRIVMRVELPDRAIPERKGLYLRGMTFDHYDGRSWVNRLGRRWPIRQTTQGIFALQGQEGGEQMAPELLSRQRILLEPLDTPVLFGAPFMEAVSGKLPAVQVDGGGSFYLPVPVANPLEYTAVSRPTTVLPADLHPSSFPSQYPEEFLRYFTQVPPTSDRIAALARTVAQHARTPYEQAMAVQDYLARHYRYSLALPVSDHTNPLEEFLFKRKTGYCEHYATAMAIMMRTLGVPSRLVTGFLATEWNEYGNYYVVRQQDAHAWVEIYLPHSGWIVMDPTPAGDENVASADGLWLAWTRLIDHLQLRWNRVVVQYSAADQLAIVQGVQTGGAAIGHKVRESFQILLETITGLMEKSVSLLVTATLGQAVATGFTVLVLLGLLRSMWLFRKRSQGKPLGMKEENERAGGPVTQLYEQMLSYLSAQGLQKPTPLGPLQFVNIVRHQWAEVSSMVEAITTLYCKERFGKVPLTLEEYDLARQRLGELRNRTRFASKSDLQRGIGAGNGI
ncbi:MAG: DUF3488 and transglutaminase-like domain-containing protein [Nitrospira sp.]|nr:DUF3488 and transglutaminase-like domain-containing protein [Nitrospira sp.]